MDLVVRSAADPALLAAAIRREVASLDPEVPVYQVHTLDAAVAQSLSTRRLTERLLAGFALAALLLASVGIYGVMALDVSRRVSEFGIRLALGATPADVLRLVLRQGLGLVIAGLCIGLGGALLLGRLVATLLFQVQPNDPVTFAGVAAILAATALAACMVAARRATATDPLVALRSE
jgi:ABC-type antimicrobial peptide transport system permease subunit